jgi:4-hydroxy-3-methylbut-2-enyl diphosphate reductase
MCFGVRDALLLARQEAASGPVTVLGDLVHNPTVLTRLREEGIRIAQNPADLDTPTVLITAHGASQRRIDEVRQRGHRVIEATCPLVHVAHQRLAHWVRQGFHPVVIGQRDHVEVRGLTGDFHEADVILHDADVDGLTPRPRYGVVAQTTQPLSRARQLLDRMRLRFPTADIRWSDTVCLPTKQRQRAAEDLAASSDIVIVVGGRHSNNTRELAATCLRSCPRVYQVQTASELQASWFLPHDSVGLTAGTSTPDDVIDAVERQIQLWLGLPVSPTSSL